MKLNNYFTQLTVSQLVRSVAGLAQARSALLASPPCAQCSVSLAATLFV